MGALVLPWVPLSPSIELQTDLSADTATAFCIAKLCQLCLVGNNKMDVKHMTSEEQTAKINKCLSLSPVMLLAGPASRLQENSSLSGELQRFRHDVLNSPTTEGILVLTLSSFSKWHDYPQFMPPSLRIWSSIPEVNWSPSIVFSPV